MSLNRIPLFVWAMLRRDLAALPTHGFGRRSVTWWGTLGFIVIEATAFVLAFATYFYLMGRVDQWPPNVPPPDPFWGMLFTTILLVSMAPNLRNAEPS
jgi:cytochrome c oxidase subunit III